MTEHDNEFEKTDEQVDTDVTAASAEQGGEPVNENEPPDPLMELQTALGDAQREAAESRDAMLRMQAEMENLRKRLIREHEKSRRRTLERFMGDLLPVRDSLERGLEAASQTATVDALIEGKQSCILIRPDNYSPCAIPKKHAGAAVIPVHNLR